MRVKVYVISDGRAYIEINDSPRNEVVYIQLSLSTKEKFLKIEKPEGYFESVVSLENFKRLLEEHLIRYNVDVRTLPEWEADRIDGQ